MNPCPHNAGEIRIGVCVCVCLQSAAEPSDAAVLGYDKLLTFLDVQHEIVFFDQHPSLYRKKIGIKGL